MPVKVITPPAPVVSLDEAKRHLIVDHPDDDLLIETYILAATTWLDGPTGWLGQVLGEQVLEIDSEHDPSCFPRLLSPLLEIISIIYTNANGTETVDTDSYQVVGDMILPLPVSPLHSVSRSRIRYKAGYPVVDGRPTLPAPIRVAILMLVAHWYHNRSAVPVGVAVTDVPFAVDALLGPYRMYR